MIEKGFAEVVLYWAEHLEEKKYSAENGISIPEVIQKVSKVDEYAGERVLFTLYSLDIGIRQIVALYNTYFLVTNGYHFKDKHGNTLKENLKKEIKNLSEL
jgi:hypothetical protein